MPVYKSQSVYFGLDQFIKYFANCFIINRASVDYIIFNIIITHEFKIGLPTQRVRNHSQIPRQRIIWRGVYGLPC